MNRRDLLVSGAAAAGAVQTLLTPVRAIAADVKSVRIRTIETFNIQIPASQTEVEAGVMNRASVTRVVTESGVRGYSFGGPGDGGFRPGGRGTASAARAGTFPQIRDALVGADLFAVEEHLNKGLLNWGGIEEAIWDAIGKAAGQPVYRLLGGSTTRIPVYITAVWRGNMDQSQVPIKDQATYALQLKEAGQDADLPAELHGRCRILRRRYFHLRQGAGIQNHGEPDRPHPGQGLGLCHRAGCGPGSAGCWRLLAGRAVCA